MEPRSEDENAQEGQCAMDPGTEDYCAAEGVNPPGRQELSLVLLPAPKRPVIGKAGLPKFEVGRYTHTVASGLRKEAERKEKERLREEKKWKEYREERERKTAMFVTPGLPPLAMAPDIDPVWLEEEMCSDEQARRLFPNDPAKQCAIKDLQGEEVSQAMYCEWLYEKKLDSDDKSSGELARCGFYEDLFQEFFTDYREVEDKYHSVMNSATVLGRFEFKNLDKDGRTIALEARLSGGELIDNENDPTIQVAYQKLWIKYPYLERFERRWELDKGTEKLEQHLRGWWAEALLDNEPEEVKRKYGYVLDRLKAEGTYDTWKKPEHESPGTEDPASPAPSSEDERESIRANKWTEGTEATEKITKRRLTI